MKDKPETEGMYLSIGTIMCKRMSRGSKTGSAKMNEDMEK